MISIYWLLNFHNLRVDAVIAEACGDTENAAGLLRETKRFIRDSAYMFGHGYNTFLLDEKTQLPLFLQFYPDYVEAFKEGYQQGQNRRKMEDEYAEQQRLDEEETLQIEAMIEYMPGSCLEGLDGGWIADGYDEEYEYNKQKGQNAMDRESEADIAQWERENLL